MGRRCIHVPGVRGDVNDLGAECGGAQTLPLRAEDCGRATRHSQKVCAGETSSLGVIQWGCSSLDGPSSIQPRTTTASRAHRPWTRFFKHGRRKRGETMNDYITRKTETYVRACQSLSRVMSTLGPGATSTTRLPSSTTRDGYWSSWQSSTGGATQGSEATGTEVFHEVPGEEEDDDEQGGGPPDPWAAAAAASQVASQEPWNSWQGSSWQDGWWSSTWNWTEPSTPAHPELLPDMIQGWYLLVDSGLDTGERNMILASLKQNFSFDRVAQELRNQWSDEDLRRKDQSSRQSSWWADADYEEDEDDDPAAFAAIPTEDLWKKDKP